MSNKISVLVIGCGNMGASHATAYHNHNGFEICGLVSRGKSKEDLNRSLGSNYPLFSFSNNTKLSLAVCSLFFNNSIISSFSSICLIKSFSLCSHIVL